MRVKEMVRYGNQENESFLEMPAWEMREGMKNISILLRSAIIS